MVFKAGEPGQLVRYHHGILTSATVNAPVIRPMTPPIVLAILIAEHVWQSPNNGSYTILGTYSGIGGFEFPLVYRSMAIFLAMTGGHGKHVMRFDLVDVDDERPPVFSTEALVDFADPRDVAQAGFQIENAVFPEPGDYRLRLFIGAEFLMERRLEVTLAGQ